MFGKRDRSFENIVALRLDGQENEKESKGVGATHKYPRLNLLRAIPVKHCGLLYFSAIRNSDPSNVRTEYQT